MDETCLIRLILSIVPHFTREECHLSLIDMSFPILLATTGSILKGKVVNGIICNVKYTYKSKALSGAINVLFDPSPSHARQAKP